MSTLPEIVEQFRANITAQVRTIIDRDDALVLVGYMEKQGFIAKPSIDSLAEVTKDSEIHPKFLRHHDVTEAEVGKLEGEDVQNFQKEYATFLETNPEIVVELQEKRAQRLKDEAGKPHPKVKGEDKAAQEKELADAASVSAISQEMAKNPRHVSTALPADLDAEDADKPAKGKAKDSKAKKAKAAKAKDAKATKAKATKKTTAKKSDATKNDPITKIGEKPVGGGTMKASDLP